MAARRSRRSASSRKPRSRRARLVAPHPSAGRGKCSSCGRWHTKSEHWSHKANAGAKSYRKKRGLTRPPKYGPFLIKADEEIVNGKVRKVRKSRARRPRSDAPRFSGSDAQKRAVSRQRKAAKEAFLAGVKAGKRDAARRAA